MDEREMMQIKEQEQECAVQIEKQRQECTMQTEEQRQECAMQIEEQRPECAMSECEEKSREYSAENAPEHRKTGMRKWWVIALIIILLAAGITTALLLQGLPPKGYQDYTVQMEQYYVEYSEEYDYWDVLTVEYPRLEGIDEEIQSQLNQFMYDTAMDRVVYWHLEPSDEVKAFQEEYFSIFCSDVNCDVTYHSQYLVSMDYQEYYSAGNPVWTTNGTQRALTVDLMTGECYELADILEIDKEFIRQWDRILSDEHQEAYADEEMLDLVLSWFLQENDEDFFYRPYFYVTEDKEFVIGISLDPVLYYAYTYEPTSRSFYTQLTMEEVEPFIKESEFWEKYEKSEPAGAILPCEDKKENIWLGENAGIWN